MCSGVGDFMAHSIVGNSGQTFQLKNKFSKKKDSYKIKTVCLNEQDNVCNVFNKWGSVDSELWTKPMIAMDLLQNVQFIAFECNNDNDDFNYSYIFLIKL